MKVLFLGTAAGKPSNHRNVTSIAVILENNDFSLVDCGEATQHQLMKSMLKLSKLREIYITHLHGDHIFGLPGLLCSLNDIRTERLKIYGPTGLHEFLHYSIKTVNNYEIDINEYGSIDHACISRISSGNYEYVTELTKVSHGILCFAYKITKIRVDNQLDMKRFYPHMDLYRNQLESMGYLPVEKIISELKSGKKITMKDNFVFKFENYIQKENKSSLIIALDNCNTDRVLYYFNSCDTLIHESTYACLPNMNQDEIYKITNKARKYKHSTNRDAAELASKLNCKQLILTHFSNRYDFDDESLIIEDSKKYTDADIHCARDFSDFCICNK